MAFPDDSTTLGPNGAREAYDADSVPHLAAEAVLSVPEARHNEAIAGLLHFLLTPEPVVEELPALFLPAGVDPHAASPDALRTIAVAGKIVYAQVRWLDHLADAEDPVAPPGHVQCLCTILSREAQARFAVALDSSGDGVAGFFSSFASLNARYAASLALDAAAARNTPFVRLGLDDYVEQAKARAAPLRAPLDALHTHLGLSEEQRILGRTCFEVASAAVQLHDDSLDVEEDYAATSLSWIVAETLRHLGDAHNRPGADEFYYAALHGGFVDRALAKSLVLYEEALRLAEEGRLSGSVLWLEKEIREARDLREDLAELVSSSR